MYPSHLKETVLWLGLEIWLGMVVCAVGPVQEADEYRTFKDSLGWIVLSGLSNKIVSIETFLTLNIRDIIR